MTLATVYSRAQVGMNAPLVSVEVDLSGGLPALSIVGLPETEVKEAKDRVRAAINNSGFRFPTGRITVNLAPADLPKEGGRFDLAIALGLLAASGQLDYPQLHNDEFLGELSLSGDLRPIRGALPAALQTKQAGRRLVVPADNAPEAGLAGPGCAQTAQHLAQVHAALSGHQSLPQAQPPPASRQADVPDLIDVRGQPQAKRALEIAAAGGHSLLMVGPPGSGKTMLASRLPGILPPMTDAQALETAAVASIAKAGFDPAKDWGVRPLRSPHHTASGVALVGGGSAPRPGEITLAHHGVLFLDELPEFDRKVLEVLREPLESGRITISRAARQAEFPASFQLIAAMNPCPCGYLGDSSGRCHCTADQVDRYRRRISGPLLDRIDMHLNVARVPRAALTAADNPDGEPSGQVQQRVIAARQQAIQRGHDSNAVLTTAQIQRFCGLTHATRNLLEQAIDRLGLSARAYHRVLKLARTIADLDASADISPAHISEAVGFRQLDRPTPF